MTPAPRFAASFGAAALVLSAAVPAPAAPKETGFELGLRTGFAIPIGKGGDNATADLNKTIMGHVPLWVDAGYRITPNVMLGAYFMYGIGIVGDVLDSACNASNASCSVSDLRLGAQVHYHFLPDRMADPWIGLGIGYEWMTISASQESEDGSLTLQGFEFVNFQGGLDFKPSDTANFGIGPFVALSLAQYSSTSCSGAGRCAGDFETSIHEWLTFGVRGTFVP